MLESLTSYWEITNGEIVGVVNIEQPHLSHPGFGEFFIQRHPDHLDLLPEMISYREIHLRHPLQRRLFIYVETEDQYLRGLLETNGIKSD